MTEETVLTLLHICLTTTNHEEALEAANTLNISDLSDLSKLQNEVLNQIRIAVKSPNFVADLKGFRFLSKVMAANHLMIESIHFATLSVMDKIPSERHTCYYAKMYVRAWDLCSSRGRQEIEMVCIRDLARRLVGLNRNDEAYLLGDFNKRLFIIMDYFFGKCARSAEVAQMMSDAFEDLVLPHLQTPNAIWRCNAADALFVAHPLERPGLDAQAKLDFLEKQHSAMLTLLTDPSHYVRYVAVRGVCDVLSKYWALVSTDKRRALFQCLGERANDGDWRVRQQLFCCFRELISSPPASAVLAELLPELRNNFHDVHRLVRLEYIRLLICIKEKATFPFYHAVSLDHLVARLGVEDVEENLEGLVKILLPYFCPLEETPEFIFKRIFALYHMNRKATWKLFLHSKGILKADEAKKFVYCVLKKVHEDAQTATAAGLGSRGRSRVGSKRRSRRGSTSNRNARTGRSVNSRPCPSPGEQTGTDTDNTAALLEIVSVLLKSGVLRDCEEEEFDELLTTLQQMLPDITDAFVDTAAQPALSILHCISGGPAQLADAMVAVRTASIDTAPFTIALHADTIIDQGRAPELVAMLVEAFITFVWGRSQGRADPEESGGRPRFLHTSAGMPDPEAAIAMLQALLLNPKQRIKLLACCFDQVSALVDRLRDVMAMLTTQPGPRRQRPPKKLLEQGFHLCAALVVPVATAAPPARRFQARAACVSRGIDLLNWAERHLIPALGGAQLSPRPVPVRSTARTAPPVPRTSALMSSSRPMSSGNSGRASVVSDVADAPSSRAGRVLRSSKAITPPVAPPVPNTCGSLESSGSSGRASAINDVEAPLLFNAGAETPVSSKSANPKRTQEPRRAETIPQQQTKSSDLGDDSPLAVSLLRNTLSTLTAMVNEQLCDRPSLVSCLDFCHLLMRNAKCCNHFIILVADLAAAALSLKEVTGGDADLMRNEIYPLTCSLLDKLPALYKTPGLRERVEQVVPVVASVACRFLIATSNRNAMSELESGIISAIGWNVMGILHKDLRKNRSKSKSIKVFEDLPLSTAFLIFPLVESSDRLSKLVQSILDWHDKSNVKKTDAAVVILRALTTPAQKWDETKEFLQNSLKQVTSPPNATEIGRDENFNLF